MRSYKLNAKTLTLWMKDERTNERTNEWTNERTNKRTDERKSENYIPPHTSYVGGIITLYLSWGLLELRKFLLVSWFNTATGLSTCILKWSRILDRSSFLFDISLPTKIIIEMYIQIAMYDGCVNIQNVFEKTASSLSSSDFLLTCRYRGNIHISGPPSR